MCEELQDMCEELKDMCEELKDMCEELKDMCEELGDMCEELTDRCEETTLETIGRTASSERWDHGVRHTHTATILTGTHRGVASVAVSS